MPATRASLIESVGFEELGIEQPTNVVAVSPTIATIPTLRVADLVCLSQSPHLFGLQVAGATARGVASTPEPEGPIGRICIRP